MKRALTTDDFRAAIEKRLAEAERGGDSGLIVNAGELHRELGGYPGTDHRLPSCCRAMRSLMCDGDTVVDGPPKGDGASFTVRYVLPRG